MLHGLVRWPPSKERNTFGAGTALTAHPPMVKAQKIQALTCLGQVHDPGLACLRCQPQFRQQPAHARAATRCLDVVPHGCQQATR